MKATRVISWHVWRRYQRWLAFHIARHAAIQLAFDI